MGQNRGLEKDRNDDVMAAVFACAGHELRGDAADLTLMFLQLKHGRVAKERMTVETYPETYALPSDRTVAIPA